MNTNRLCCHGGYVVGGQHRIPDDACEYSAAQVNAVIGCNRLRCTRCGELVRHSEPGWAGKADLRANVAALYAAETWVDHPLLEPKADNYRLYACKCTTWAGFEDYPTDPVDPDPSTDPVFPWRCDGHPTPKLPIAWDAVTLADASETADLVDRILNGWSPRDFGTVTVDPGPTMGLAWLYSYLLGLPEADALSCAVADRLTDSASDKAAAALFFFSRFPFAEGFEAVLRLAENRADDVIRGYPLPKLRSYTRVLDTVASRIQFAKRPFGAFETRCMDVFQRSLVTPLSAMSTDPIGDLDLVERFQRELADESGQLDEVAERRVRSFERNLAAVSKDVPAFVLFYLLGDPPVFDESELSWLAEHIVDIERGGKGRWKTLLNVLVTADVSRPEELSHLIVVAGVALAQSTVVPRDELAQWVDSRGTSYPWAMPIQVALQTA